MIVNKRIVLKRLCSEKTNDATIQKQVNYIVHRMLSGGRGVGWESKVREGQKPFRNANGYWEFTYIVELHKENGRTWETQWPKIVHYAIKTGGGTMFNKFPWKVVEPIENEVGELIGEELATEVFLPEPDRVTVHDNKLLSTEPAKEKTYADLSLDRGNHFDEIYDRWAQIERVISSIKAAKHSNMENRFHCVLYGPPGCGKSQVLLSVCAMLGKEYEAYIKLDATSTSEAGIKKFLLDPDNAIPPVLMIEEIEKTSETSLRWLLGVLDKRGEIRKLNYRINEQRNVPMLCLATVNNMDLFKSMMAGALASRFPNKLYCPRPGRDILKKILEREVAKVAGKAEWIEATLQFAHDKLGIDDPREITPICLQGADDLIAGYYQRWYCRTLEPEIQEKLKNKYPELF